MTSYKSFLEVIDLKKYFPSNNSFLDKDTKFIKAVDGISFTLNEEETLGFVGESGSGKSTAARTLLRLEIPTSGSVHFKQKNLVDLSETEIRNLRKEMQMIFQDPFSSINPRRKIGEVLSEPFEIHNIKENICESVKELLNQVGLSPNHAYRYPHEMSGGQLQRVGIARAIALNPSLVVADEPVSALDVSVQAQVLNLMMSLQEELSLSYLFISHDMAVVERVSHKVGVMYLGRLVEIGSRSQIFENPQHNYTRSLMKAVPIADPKKRNISGDISFTPIPSPVFPIGYSAEEPLYEEIETGHLVLKNH